jgi:23S rRNA (guanine745-N1)-methyltransferase
VRGCEGPLARAGKTLVCPRGHSFDVARSGYVNLLQPQDRRSKSPGDSREAVQARRRLVDGGHERWMVGPIVEVLDSVSKRTKADPPAALDLGCGEGYLLGSIAGERKIDGFGVDISVPAIELAAKTYPELTWLVANADRRLPLRDAAFDFVMSVTARRNGAELARLLSRHGRALALVVVPGLDDLAELREAVLGRAEHRDRTASAIEELAPHLELVSRRSLRKKTLYAANDVRDLLPATYRGGRTRERERAEEIGEMEITSSRELLLFRLP